MHEPVPPVKEILCLALAAVTSLTSVHAQLVVSNLANSNDGTASGSVGSDKWSAQGFRTSGSDVTLSTVGLKLGADAGASGTYTISLWNASGTGGTPGSQLNVISSGNPMSALPQLVADQFFSAPAGISLTANTTYFIVLTSSTSAFTAPALNWGITGSPSSTGPGQIGGWADSRDNGHTWGSDAGTDYTDQTVSTSFPFQIGINAVPEPATYAVAVGLGLLGFAAVRRWGVARTAEAEVENRR